MPKGYTKEDVDFHNDWNGPRKPAINVKVYHYPTPWQVKDEFNCSIATAEQALGYALESAQWLFWNEYAQEEADFYLAPQFGKVKVYSEGRSSGWLVVEGVVSGYRGSLFDESPISEWDALDLTAWYRFQKAIKETIKYLCSWEVVKEDIEANRWAEEGAELYNYYEFADGHSECFVDMKQENRACPHCATVLV